MRSFVICEGANITFCLSKDVQLFISTKPSRLNKASESVFHYEKIVNTAACADYMVSLNKLINHAAGSSVHHLANGREAMLAMPHWLFLLRDIQM